MPSSLLITSLKLMRNKNIKRIPKKTVIGLLAVLKNERFISFDDKILFSLHLPPYPSKALDRFFEAGTKAMEGVNVPGIVNIAVTHQCRYHCWHCSASPKNGTDLPLQVITEAIHKFQDMGTYLFSITGGEPLLRDDLVDIIASIDDRSTVFVFTSGDGLTKEKARELKQAGLFGVMLSLDHYTPGIHNHLRGYNGAYDNFVNGVRNAQAAHLYVGISSVITKEILKNNEQWKLFETAQNLSVQEIMMFEPTPVGELFHDDTCLLSTDERRQLIEFHKQVNSNRKYKKYPKLSVFPYYESEEFQGCTAGFSLVYIDADGNLRPCDFVPLIFGNIQEEPLEGLWQKMNHAFQKPRAFCFMLENHKLMEHIGNGEYPLSYVKSLEVCQRCPSSRIPRIYKKIGIT
jgi:MoaA/NifB/PqqE/SkfB family radical SAM enzyme